MQRAIEYGSGIKLLIAEQSLLSCQLMEAALQKNRQISVVASVVDHDECLEAYKASNPGICVVSGALKNGQTAGFHLTRELRSLDRDASVILLLESSQKSMVIEAFHAGARGIFSRDQSFEVLAKCIQKVHEGQVWANNEQLQYLVESMSETAAPAGKDAKGGNLLTKRELSLVELVAEGRTNRDISRELHLSEHTVRNYLFRIFNKLGTSNRLELALYAINQKSGDRNQFAEKDS
jgi:DNA-binding NarL/FixJ family response regulator